MRISFLDGLENPADPPQRLPSHRGSVDGNRHSLSQVERVEDVRFAPLTAPLAGERGESVKSWFLFFPYRGVKLLGHSAYLPFSFSLLSE